MVHPVGSRPGDAWRGRRRGLSGKASDVRLGRPCLGTQLIQSPGWTRESTSGGSTGPTGNGGRARAEPIVYIDHSDIRPGGLDEVRKAIPELVGFIDEQEPQLIFYAFYIDEQASAMTVVALHPDSASLELHMEIGGPQFRKLAAFIDMRLIEVYGEPSETGLNQLQQKADMLGEDGRVVVHEPQAVFARFPSAGS